LIKYFPLKLLSQIKSNSAAERRKMNAKISQLLPFQEISIFNTGTCSYLGWRDGLLHKILHRGQTKDPLSPILFNLVTIVLMHFFGCYQNKPNLIFEQLMVMQLH
jgi:hypothetical protein